MCYLRIDAIQYAVYTCLFLDEFIPSDLLTTTKNIILTEKNKLGSRHKLHKHFIKHSTTTHTHTTQRKPFTNFFLLIFLPSNFYFRFSKEINSATLLQRCIFFLRIENYDGKYIRVFFPLFHTFALIPAN